MTLKEQFDQLVTKSAEASGEYQDLLRSYFSLEACEISSKDFELLSYDLDRARDISRFWSRNLCLFILKNCDFIRIEE